MRQSLKNRLQGGFSGVGPIFVLIPCFFGQFPVRGHFTDPESQDQSRFFTYRNRHRQGLELGVLKCVHFIHLNGANVGVLLNKSLVFFLALTSKDIDALANRLPMDAKKNRHAPNGCAACGELENLAINGPELLAIVNGKLGIGYRPTTRRTPVALYLLPIGWPNKRPESMPLGTLATFDLFIHSIEPPPLLLHNYLRIVKNR